MNWTGWWSYVALNSECIGWLAQLGIIIPSFRDGRTNKQPICTLWKSKLIMEHQNHIFSIGNQIIYKWAMYTIATCSLTLSPLLIHRNWCKWCEWRQQNQGTSSDIISNSAKAWCFQRWHEANMGGFGILWVKQDLQVWFHLTCSERTNTFPARNRMVYPVRPPVLWVTPQCLVKYTAGKLLPQLVS